VSDVDKPTVAKDSHGLRVDRDARFGGSASQGLSYIRNTLKQVAEVSDSEQKLLLYGSVAWAFESLDQRLVEGDVLPGQWWASYGFTERVDSLGEVDGDLLARWQSTNSEVS
jgi:hypothetical protein